MSLIVVASSRFGEPVLRDPQVQAYEFVVRQLEQGHSYVGVTMPTGCGKQLLMYLLRFGLKHKQHGNCGRCLFLAPFIGTNQDNYKQFVSEVLGDRIGLFSDRRQELDTIKNRPDTIICTDSKSGI